MAPIIEEGFPLGTIAGIARNGRVLTIDHSTHNKSRDYKVTMTSTPYGGKVVAFENGTKVIDTNLSSGEDVQHLLSDGSMVIYHGHTEEEVDDILR